jgi:O-acetyl-ADP-ribose deacetylase (regulator of RNase III)
MNYIKGNLFSALKQAENDIHSLKENPVLIAHCCNNIGAWGKGFVVALSNYSKAPETNYKIWTKEQRNLLTQLGEPIPRHILPLGQVQLIPINTTVETHNSIVVANIIGQHDIRSYATKQPPIRYQALHQGLQEAVNQTCQDGRTWRLWCPKMGAGLAGGEWEKVEKIIDKVVSDSSSFAQIDVTIFEL